MPGYNRGRCNYSKRLNKFLFPALAGAIYSSSCKAENEISSVVNYSYIVILRRLFTGADVRMRSTKEGNREWGSYREMTEEMHGTRR